jgi:hypothetical protein
MKRFMVFSMPVVYLCNASVASANALAIWKNVSVRRKTFLERLLALWFFGTSRRAGDAEQAECKAGSEVAGDCCWAPG